jgi:hypothetical protein
MTEASSENQNPLKKLITKLHEICLYYCCVAQELLTEVSNSKTTSNMSFEPTCKASRAKITLPCHKEHKTDPPQLKYLNVINSFSSQKRYSKATISLLLPIATAI